MNWFGVAHLLMKSLKSSDHKSGSLKVGGGFLQERKTNVSHTGLLFYVANKFL